MKKKRETSLRAPFVIIQYYKTGVYPTKEYNKLIQPLSNDNESIISTKRVKK